MAAAATARSAARPRVKRLSSEVGVHRRDSKLLLTLVVSLKEDERIVGSNLLRATHRRNA